MRSLLFVLFLTVVALVSAKHKINALDRLIAKDEIKELHYDYNTNLDALAAVWSGEGNSANFQARVAHVVGIFCPDPDFQGWNARVAGANGAEQLVFRAAHRDTPSTLQKDANGNVIPDQLSVLTAYRDMFGQVWAAGSSQHFVGMPIVDVYYGEDDRLYAEVNMTLHQSYLFNNTGTIILAHAFNHYNNFFVKYDEGGVNGEGFWCMRQFNSNNHWGPVNLPGTFFAQGQVTDTNYLAGNVRPDPVS